MATVYFKQPTCTIGIETVDGTNNKARAVLTNDAVYLISYETVICVLTRHGSVAKFQGRWSKTTARHVRQFIKQYADIDLELKLKEYAISSLIYYQATLTKEGATWEQV